ncbi:dienelactone hydrolase family protein [Luteipulveratus sp. YIM 133132]|uniref:alpha/beta hydrolase family protein n=1 Tax=Luteipulveratus flavus TaxID=3031728 RepID=UPI0023B15301|nr:dienelactone hydrolase family protein [Luteipulveratus sp. YIM 133132]MDE9364708.1 dienelactone hydrolase family protein [Luteipulveratus sp. YIM 133132]
MKSWTPRSAAAAVALSAAVVGVAAPAGPASASVVERPQTLAADNPARNGPYAYTSTTVSDAATPGFGAATIYYPTSTTGTVGGVAISPGFTETQSAISWFGPRLASHGFVVITFNTNSGLDSPDSRGAQLLAALDYLTGSSAVKAKVDPSRLAVMGHSMGGGGTLAAAKSRPSLKAAIPLAPWHTDKTWPEVTTPTLIVGAENDTIAPVADHAEPFYTSLPANAEHAYLELNNASHSATNSDNPATSVQSVSWLKHFVNGDTSYDSYLCPGPAPSSTVEEYRSTCPF